MSNKRRFEVAVWLAGAVICFALGITSDYTVFGTILGFLSGTHLSLALVTWLAYNDSSYPSSSAS